MKRYLVFVIFGVIFIGIITTYLLVITKSDVLKDIDGNHYLIKKYNDQIWMKENLKVTSDQEGNPIKAFFPNNVLGNVENFGMLYDFETACKVCPKGWHLPTYEEWIKLTYFIGHNSGDILKDTLYWKNINQRISNKSGFSIRPAGYGNSGEFDNFFGTHAIFWSATKVDSHFVWGFILDEKSDTIRKAPQHPTYAFSVRCIKDNQSN